MTKLIPSGIKNWRPGKLKNFFYDKVDKVSREEHKTISSGLRISRMALSNQSDLPAFLSSQKINLKISLIREDDLPRMGQISEDDLPRLTKSRLTTSRNLKRGIDETNSLKPSSGDERIRLVVSRN